MRIVHLFARARDRLVASDPAFSRLRLASRAVLSLILTGAFLAAVDLLVHPLPVAAFGLGVVLSMLGSMVIRDSSAREQLVSRAYAGIGAFGSVVLAATLARWPLAGYAGFLLVIFVAVYIRRFSPRWFGVGMLAFMAYFMGDFLHPQASDLGWIALGAGAALCVTHVIAIAVLKDDPERDFRRALITIDRRIHLILDQLRRHEGRPISRRGDRKTLLDELGSLREAVLMAEGFIPQGEGGALADEGPAAELAMALFELQLAVERVTAGTFDRNSRDDLLRAAQTHDREALEQAVDETEGDGPFTEEARLLLRLVSARQTIDVQLDEYPSKAFDCSPEIVVPTAKVGSSSSPPIDNTGFVPESLQLPIQVTTATAVALAGGLMLSPVRWYWAVITAFIVFNNTQSRSDTLVRAAQRSLGTLAGLVIGSLAATGLAGHAIGSAALILLLFFFAFYFIQVSYSVMIFCITIALALIYGVMGMFTPELLVLRLEETLIGAVAGVGAAFLLFGRRVSVAASDKLGDYFDALQELLEAARARLCGESGNPELLALSRRIDRIYAELALIVRPMGGPWRTVTRFGAVRQKLLLLTGCAHWARSLAGSMGPGRCTDDQLCAPAREIIADIETKIAEGRAQGVGLFQRASSGAPQLSSEAHRPLSEASPISALDMIARLLGRMIS